MMSRILGTHTSIFSFNELHFFEQVWDPTDQDSLINRNDAEFIAARLLTIQRDGYYHQKNPKIYLSEAKDIISSLDQLTSYPEVYSHVLHYETHNFGKSIPCDQTPRNVFFLKEILDLFPQAFVIVMVRDSRDVLLSQKKKWQRRSLGAQSIPRWQSLRFWANYHPMTMSLMWKNAIKAVKPFQIHPRVLEVRFEDLINDPEKKVLEICDFLKIDFQTEMLDIPRVGSSHQADQIHLRGVDPSIAGRWQREHADKSDLLVCERITSDYLVQYGYSPGNEKLNIFYWLRVFISWPIKSAIAFLLNLGRTRNPWLSVRRRILK